jgi:hypothetical protein
LATLAPVTSTAVGLQIVQPGDRATDILHRLAERLGRAPLEPDGTGHVFIVFDVPGTEAWALVAAQLDEVAPDWRTYLSMGAALES